MLLLQHQKGNRTTSGPLESLGRNTGKTETIGRTIGGSTCQQAAEGCGSRNNGRGRSATTLGGLRVRFLKGRVPPQPLAHAIICGASRKRKNERPSVGTPKKPRRTPCSGTRPVIEIVLHQGSIRHRIRALLNTGCSIALINEQTVGRLGLERKKHQHAHSIENFTGETVKRAGQYYTKPMLLQH